jgi:hypothetical protein
MVMQSRTAVTIILGILLAGVAGTATAREFHPREERAHETHWERNHPARDQVNDRLARQHQRIRREVREGELTRAQAHQIHQEEHQVRADERGMAKNQQGHITHAQQAQLNQQENQISRQIGE